MSACCVSQVGDREWWCATHRRDAETCESRCLDCGELKSDSGVPGICALWHDDREAVTCRHCGALPDADGDHSCPCPNRDEECPDHVAP